MSYTSTRTAEGRASSLLSWNTFVIPQRATRLRESFQYIARKGNVTPSGYACARYDGYHVGTADAAAKLWDNLVSKGLVVKLGEGLNARYCLSPAQQESYDHFLTHYQAEIDAEKAAEAKAEAAALDVQRWAVLLVHLDNAYTEILCIVGGADAERHTYHRAAQCNTPGIKAIAVRLADAERPL